MQKAKSAWACSEESERLEAAVYTRVYPVCVVALVRGEWRAGALARRTPPIANLIRPWSEDLFVKRRPFCESAPPGAHFSTLDGARSQVADFKAVAGLVPICPRVHRLYRTVADLTQSRSL